MRRAVFSRYIKKSGKNSVLPEQTEAAVREFYIGEQRGTEMKIADLHCDTVSRLYAYVQSGKKASLRQNPFQVDLEKMKKGQYGLQNFAIYVDLQKERDPYEAAKAQLTLFKEQMRENRDCIRQVVCQDDMEENDKTGRMSALLTMEEGEICGGDIAKLHEFYAAGIRMMTFTWNYKNSLGYPASPQEPDGKNGGLTEKGIIFLQEMEHLGIIPDVSHLSEQGFYDVCQYSRRPFVASHSNAYSLCPHPRNLSDDMIRQIGEHGGLIGVNYYGTFLDTLKENHGYSTVSRIADHILQMIHTGGLNCVALGSDFDGIDEKLELTDCSRMELLWQELKHRGLTEREIDAVTSGNVYRLYEEILRK